MITINDLQAKEATLYRSYVKANSLDVNQQKAIDDYLNEGKQGHAKIINIVDLKKHQSVNATDAKFTKFQPETDSILSDKPSKLPVLNRAQKLQKPVEKYGFDWPNIKPVIEKLEEEIVELKVEISKAEEASLDDEVHNHL
jgi:uncharacterized protein YabN with tetrapyrrole methylase and pyrophosphatase domain